MRPEALLATKHLYRTAWWMRCVEAMCSTHFVIGPHHTMVNDFSHTRAKMMAMTLQNQSDGNIHLPQEETMVPGFEEDYGPHTNKGNWGASSSKQRKFWDYSWSFCKDAKEWSEGLCHNGLFAHPSTNKIWPRPELKTLVHIVATKNPLGPLLHGYTQGTPFPNGQ